MGKQKPSTSRDFSAGPGGFQPFAGIEIGGLPPGADPAPEPSPDPLRPRHAPHRERLVLRREKAGRGGKTVVVITGFAPGRGAAFLEDLAARLRKACGCGGTVRPAGIEIQGDQPDRVRRLLEEEGYRVAGP